MTSATGNQHADSAQLNLLLTNACGVYSKFGELHHLLLQQVVDIAIVTESQLTSDKCSQVEAAIPGYSGSIRRDKTANGGGITLWLKEGLVYQHLERYQSDAHEVIWLTVLNMQNQKTVIGAVATQMSPS